MQGCKGLVGDVDELKCWGWGWGRIGGRGGSGGCGMDWCGSGGGWCLII